jgi:hypothetical protein
MPSVNIIAPAYGFGYQADLELISNLLEQNGFDVTRTPLPDIRKSHRAVTFARTMARRLSRFDVNIFLGGIFPEWLPFARKNISVPNVEDIASHHHKLLPRIDLFIAKTRFTERVFREKGLPIEYSGFTSRDLLDTAVPRGYGTFFHACSSQFKGTKRLVELWAKHPEWPELVVTINHNPTIPEALPPNIRAYRRPMTQAEVVQIRNAHVFHLCPSEVEGFGHYIVEAMSCRAVVFTNDCPPMNELVQPSRGILFDILKERPPKGFSHRCFFSPTSVEEKVERALKMDPSEIEQIGASARAFFLESREAFFKRFPEVVRSV